MNNANNNLNFLLENFVDYNFRQLSLKSHKNRNLQCKMIFLELKIYQNIENCKVHEATTNLPEICTLMCLFYWLEKFNKKCSKTVDGCFSKSRKPPHSHAMRKCFNQTPTLPQGHFFLGHLINNQSLLLGNIISFPIIIEECICWKREELAIKYFRIVIIFNRFLSIKNISTK